MISSKPGSKSSAQLAMLAAVLAVGAAGVMQVRAAARNDGTGVLPAASPKAATEITAVISRFTPSTVSVTVGVPTTLRFVSQEGVHGISSEALGIPATVMSPDKPVVVTFTAQKPGTYPLHCAIVCGPKHADMLLTVEAKGDGSK